MNENLTPDSDTPDDSLRWYARPAEDSVRPQATELDEPIYFAVPEWKFAVLSICTSGLYQTYWAFKNWQMVSGRAGKSRIWGPLVRAFFAPIFGFSLFSHINSSAWGANVGRLPVAAIGIAWLLLSAAGSLPTPFGLLNYASFVPLLFVQRVVNQLNAELRPAASKNESFTAWEIVAMAVGVAFSALGVLFQFAPHLVQEWAGAP